MFQLSPKEGDMNPCRMPLPIEVYQLISEAHAKAHELDRAEQTIINWPNGTLMQICMAVKEARQIAYN